MNPDLEKLHSYPFAKLRTLLSGVEANTALEHISLAVGEPKNQPPVVAIDALKHSLPRINAYPAAKGELALRSAVAEWLERRYGLAGAIDAETMVLPVLGTREALFAVAQALIDRSVAPQPLVVMPSPFYQIYEGAAIMSGARPYYLPSLEGDHFLPALDRVPAQVWQQCQLMYVCNPSNPTGAVFDAAYYQKLIALADEYDFYLVSDECYSEIYADEAAPCTGLLEVCAQLGRNTFERCLVFNSLSKRSNLAGMRSGFVAGDSRLVEAFLQYRTYHGSAMPFHHQAASVAAWRDETHVIENRAFYRRNIEAVVVALQKTLAVDVPPGGFCLWLKAPIDDTEFARQLFCQQHVTVLPGQYLARSIDGVNAGFGYVRMALVEPLAVCLEAAERINEFVGSVGDNARR